MDHDCLFRYASTANHLGRHLVPYCLRSIESIIVNKRTCYGTNYTFRALSYTNVTVKDLFDWQAPIDLTSDYARFLETGFGANRIFCNCSDVKYFGTRCQYSFAFNSILFDDIIEQTFALYNKKDTLKQNFDVRTLTDTDFTCYLLFNCTTYIGWCLDWRQICDGIRDCTNGRDEENCVQMELNECDTQSEYRCRNGMCVPKSFSFDLTMDCMDFYDEQMIQDKSRYCSNESSVDCEDHSCGLSDFSCGDGSCFSQWITLDSLYDFYMECDNQRNSLYLKHIFKKQENSNLKDECWWHMWCLLGLSCLFESVNITSPCQEGIYRNAAYCQTNAKLHLSCPKMFFFPPTHFVLPFVYLLYERKEYYYEKYSYFTEPTAICYNKSLCDIYLSEAMEMPSNFDEYICVEIDEFAKGHLFTNRVAVVTLTQLATILHAMFSHCTVQSAQVNSLFQCSTHFLISFHRILDGHSDCLPDTLDESYGSLACQLNLTERYKCSMYDSLHEECIPRRFLLDGISQCDDRSDELFALGCTDVFDCQYFRELDLSTGIPIIYQELCNVFKILHQEEGYNHTDETDCDEWPCHAYATRCDGVWNVPNGCDELNCPNTIPYFIAHHVANCSANEHYCLQYNSTEMSCLPLSKANDGIIDCLFASDERANTTSTDGTHRNSQLYQVSKAHCYNQPSEVAIEISQLCDRRIDCLLADDEYLCPWHMNSFCFNGQFTCKNGTCLSREKRCNWQIDYAEAEDEWACDFENGIARFTGCSKSP